MILFHGKKPERSERGVALIVALMLLLLISAALMGMIMMSNTETNVSANFRDEQTAFFASKAGVEEVRDRMRAGATDSLITNTFFTPSPTPPPGTPLPLPGTANGVLYITNPAPGETVTPWLPLGTNYPDNEICQEVTCTSGVPTGSWYVTPAASASTSYTAAPILPWKWVRVMAKANKSDTGTTRVTSVDGTTNGNRVCWTGTNEIATTAASCPAISISANYQPVYELTALAVTSSGSRRMTQYEVSQTAFPGIPGAFVFDGSNPIFNVPHSNPFAVSGTDPTHTGAGTYGTINGVACSAPANQPALGAYDQSSVISLTNNVSGQPSRATNYTSGSSPTPVISNDYSTLSSGSINLTTVDGLTKLVNSMTTAAGGNVYGASPLPNPSTMNLGTSSAPVVNVVQGDLSLSGSGSGILLVTGQLTLNGAFSYNGIILVIGKGAITKSGGGSATVNGAMFSANLYSDIPPIYSNLIPLGSNNAPGTPSFAWSGGGSSTIQYDSCWISAVTRTLPFNIVAQRELIY